MNITQTPAEASEPESGPEVEGFRPGLMILGILSSLFGISLIITVALLPFDATPLGLELATVIIGLMVIFSVLLIGGGFGVVAVATRKLQQANIGSTAEKLPTDAAQSLSDSSPAIPPDAN